ARATAGPELAADSPTHAPFLFHAAIVPRTLSQSRPRTRAVQHGHRASAPRIGFSIPGQPLRTNADWPPRIVHPAPDATRSPELEFPAQPGRHALPGGANKVIARK